MAKALIIGQERDEAMTSVLVHHPACAKAYFAQAVYSFQQSELPAGIKAAALGGEYTHLVLVSVGQRYFDGEEFIGASGMKLVQMDQLPGNKGRIEFSTAEVIAVLNSL